MPLSNPTSKCRGAARGPARLDRRPGPGRHRQPVRPGRARRRHLPHRPGQQRPGLPRPRPGRDRGAGMPDHRPHDRRGRRRRRRPVRRHPSGRAAAARRCPTCARSRRRSPSPSPRPPWPRASPSSRSTTRSSRSTRPCGGPSTRGWRPSRSGARLVEAHRVADGGAVQHHGAVAAGHARPQRGDGLVLAGPDDLDRPVISSPATGPPGPTVRVSSAVAGSGSVAPGTHGLHLR